MGGLWPSSGLAFHFKATPENTDENFQFDCIPHFMRREVQLMRLCLSSSLPASLSASFHAQVYVWDFASIRYIARQINVLSWIKILYKFKRYSYWVIMREDLFVLVRNMDMEALSKLSSPYLISIPILWCYTIVHICISIPSQNPLLLPSQYRHVCHPHILLSLYNYLTNIGMYAFLKSCSLYTVPKPSSLYTTTL